MDTQRLILLFIFGFSVLMLWEAWDREHRPKPPPAPIAQPAVPAPGKAPAKASPAAPGPIASTAPAELRGEMFFAVRHANALQRLFSFFFPLGCAHVAIGKREFDVFIDREIAD